MPDRTWHVGTKKGTETPVPFVFGMNDRALRREGAHKCLSVRSPDSGYVVPTCGCFEGCVRAKRDHEPPGGEGTVIQCTKVRGSAKKRCSKLIRCKVGCATRRGDRASHVVRRTNRSDISNRACRETVDQGRSLAEPCPAFCAAIAMTAEKVGAPTLVPPITLTPVTPPTV